MNGVKFGTIGETWIQLVEATVRAGVSVNEETLELTAVPVAFSANTEGDGLIRQFGDARMVAEMDKVFFADGANSLGHQYSDLMKGPGGRHDLEDVISLLRSEPASKRAVVTLCGQGNGKVPCVNVVQFLIRADAVQMIYFARGQDVFKKFYADALCLAKMARRVADRLHKPAEGVEGFIGSSHVYHADRPAIDDFLKRAKPLLPNGAAKGSGK